MFILINQKHETMKAERQAKVLQIIVISFIIVMFVIAL
jgi:hypothetical protein